MFTDTHCHIHEETYAESEEAYSRAVEAGVTRLICVGTDLKTSREAVEFALSHENVWATVGIHPHEAKHGQQHVDELRKLLEDDRSRTKIVGIGEIGLDYYYNHSPKDVQVEVFRAQIELAKEFDLPISFHVRDALPTGELSPVWDDFWPIVDESWPLRGVLHSYTDNLVNLEKAISKGLYIGVNGIATFAKDKTDVYQAIPMEKLLLETDAPFLTPVPKRGTVNEPAFITFVAKCLSDLHSVSLKELSVATERNATTLFLNK